jgi:hypothetical protein
MTEREWDASDAAAHAATTPADLPEDAESEEAAVAEAASDAAAHEVDAEDLDEVAEVDPVDDDDGDVASAEAASDAAAHEVGSSMQDDRAVPRGEEVTDGELITRLEALLPLTFGAMLVAVCYIAVYFAVEQLPRRTNPLPGPEWVPFL